jgi:uncharacterized protein (DUF58 family)
VLLALSLAAILAPELRTAVLALDLLLAGAVASDLARTPSPKSIALERHLPARAGLGAEFQRVLRVRLAAAAGLSLEVREEFPASFEVRARSLAGEPGSAAPVSGDPTGGPDRARLPADGSEVAIARTYRASRRGVHSLGDVRLRLRSPLGLLERQSRLAGSQEIRIEPLLAGLRRTLRLAASERWHDLGVRSLRRRGGMTEFESLRDYVRGDDLRLIDWKAFARRGKPTVREFQVERGQELILLVDCGRRMAATTAGGEGTAGWTKLDHALDAALQLAAVALQEGDRVGALAFDSAARAWVAPRRGRRVLARLHEALFALEPSERESNLARALLEVGTRHRRRALLVVLSDVADPLSLERQRRALAQGARAHRVVFAALDDPALRRAADGAGPPSPDASAVRAAALDLLLERRTSLRRLSGAGARVLDTLPAEAAGPLLAAWLAERR